MIKSIQSNGYTVTGYILNVSLYTLVRCREGELPSYTAGYAKNIISRALVGIVDPDPTDRQINSMWKYFDSACAYCEVRLVRGQRKSHVDHLVSCARGGTNHISNRVLACATCNGDKKRDRDWREFLTEIKGRKSTFKERAKRIKNWQSSCPEPISHGVDVDYLEHQIANAKSAFDVAVANIRQSKTT